jgi:hypothetical protein
MPRGKKMVSKCYIQLTGDKELAADVKSQFDTRRTHVKYLNLDTDIKCQ